MRIVRIGFAVILIIFLVVAWRLDYLERAGPPHAELELPGGIPATLYMPGPANPFDRLKPLPPERRRPAVVLLHGFTADRAAMSTLARWIAQNGYAVLAIDFRGHGQNRNPFAEDFAFGWSLRANVKAAVDYLRGSRYVDGSRIIVMGHSMGAGAALDYALHDSDLKGAVMISGGWRLTGTAHPADSLFIFAAEDPAQIQGSSEGLAAILAGVDQIKLGKTYGDVELGTAVRAVRIPAVNHLSIISSRTAAREIIKWIDGATDTTRKAPVDLRDPRRSIALAAELLMAILLVGVGRITGRLAPSWTSTPMVERRWIGFAALAVALVAVMPLVGGSPPFRFLSLIVGDVVVSWLSIAGGVLLVGIAIASRTDLKQITPGIIASTAAALVGVAAIYAMSIPTGMVFHQMTLTPERLIIAIGCAILLAPFFLGFELIVRRGNLLISTLSAILGRAIVLVLMVLGIVAGVLPGILILLLPVLVLWFVQFEIFAASAYSAGRNLGAIAIVEAAWLGWMLAAIMPVTFML